MQNLNESGMWSHSDMYSLLTKREYITLCIFNSLCSNNEKDEVKLYSSSIMQKALALSDTLITECNKKNEQDDND